MRILGLTGPTGAGKGKVGTLLKERGAYIIDTDQLARDIVQPGSPCLAALAARFGNEILLEDGSLDRAVLAEKAFASPTQKAALEAITHPAIIALTHTHLAACDAALAVIDAPLLFESGMDTICDKTLAVLAPQDLRLQRIMQRDGITADAARRRMNAQHDDAFYRERADITIINDTDEDTLCARLDGALSILWEGLA